MLVRPIANWFRRQTKRPDPAPAVFEQPIGRVVETPRGPALEITLTNELAYPMDPGLNVQGFGVYAGGTLRQITLNGMNAADLDEADLDAISRLMGGIMADQIDQNIWRMFNPSGGDDADR